MGDKVEEATQSAVRIHFERAAGKFSDMKDRLGSPQLMGRQKITRSKPCSLLRTILRPVGVLMFIVLMVISLGSTAQSGPSELYPGDIYPQAKMDVEPENHLDNMIDRKAMSLVDLYQPLNADHLKGDSLTKTMDELARHLDTMIEERSQNAEVFRSELVSSLELDQLLNDNSQAKIYQSVNQRSSYGNAAKSTLARLTNSPSFNSKISSILNLSGGFAHLVDELTSPLTSQVRAASPIREGSSDKFKSTEGLASIMKLSEKDGWHPPLNVQRIHQVLRNKRSIDDHSNSDDQTRGGGYNDLGISAMQPQLIRTASSKNSNMKKVDRPARGILYRLGQLHNFVRKVVKTGFLIMDRLVITLEFAERLPAIGGLVGELKKNNESVMNMVQIVRSFKAVSQLKEGISSGDAAVIGEAVEGVKIISERGMYALQKVITKVLGAAVNSDLGKEATLRVAYYLFLKLLPTKEQLDDLANTIE